MKKEKITRETLPGTVITKIITRPGGRAVIRERVAVDSIEPSWCSGDCKTLSRGMNGRAKLAYRCGKYNFDLRSKQGNPVRCMKCRSFFNIPREVLA